MTLAVGKDFLDSDTLKRLSTIGVNVKDINDLVKMLDGTKDPKKLAEVIAILKGNEKLVGYLATSDKFLQGLKNNKYLAEAISETKVFTDAIKNVMKNLGMLADVGNGNVVKASIAVLLVDVGIKGVNNFNANKKAIIKEFKQIKKTGPLFKRYKFVSEWKNNTISKALHHKKTGKLNLRGERYYDSWHLNKALTETSKKTLSQRLKGKLTGPFTGWKDLTKFGKGMKAAGIVGLGVETGLSGYENFNDATKQGMTGSKRVVSTTVNTGVDMGVSIGGAVVGAKVGAAVGTKIGM